MLVSDGDEPLPRKDPSAVWSESAGCMLVFGGAAGPEGNYAYLGDLWAFDPLARRWQKRAPSGPTPPARWRHSAVMHSGSMYVIGGNNGNGFVDGLWAYE